MSKKSTKRSPARTTFKFKVGSVVYKGKVTSIPRSENAQGLCYTRKKRILVEESLPKDQQDSVKLHELLEAINYEYGMELPHRALQTLEIALYIALKPYLKL